MVTIAAFALGGAALLGAGIRGILFYCQRRTNRPTTDTVAPAEPTVYAPWTLPGVLSYNRDPASLRHDRIATETVVCDGPMFSTETPTHADPSVVSVIPLDVVTPLARVHLENVPADTGLLYRIVVRNNDPTRTAAYQSRAVPLTEPWLPTDDDCFKTPCAIAQLLGPLLDVPRVDTSRHDVGVEIVSSHGKVVQLSAARVVCTVWNVSTSVRSEDGKRITTGSAFYNRITRAPC
jgi:hypothetical protein